jgi:hypothetical protein
MTATTRAIGLLTCAVLAGTALAADKLNVKTGLWELTTVTSVTGMPPIPKDMLEKLSPEQRAAVEEGMQHEASRAPERQVSKECITPKDLEDPFTGSSEEKDCKHTVVTRTATTQEIRLVCNGTPKGSGSFKVSTPTPESMTGDLNVKMGEGKEVMEIKATVTGKWLSATCPKEEAEG